MATSEKKSAGKFAGKKKELTSERLDAIALRYVSRYAASTGMLERVLKRHVQKAAYQNPDFDSSLFMERISQILARYVAKGWIDDQAMAKRVVENGKLGGLSRRKITQKLQLRGIGADLIHNALTQENEDGDDDLAAARIFAKRRHLGRHRKGKPDDTTFTREMGKLCRAGFPPAIARKVLEETDDA